jgi:hypothetical protein
VRQKTIWTGVRQKTIWTGVRQKQGGHALSVSEHCRKKTKRTSMKFIILSIIINILLSVSTFGQTIDNNEWLLQLKLPDWTISTYKKLNLDTIYKFSDYINPFYLEADFNGDNNLDIAITVEQKKTKYKGIMIFHGSSENYFVFGTDTNSIGGDNFDWIDVWKVYRDTIVNELTLDANNNIKYAPPIKIIGQGLLIEQSEKAGGIIYWDGKQYKWAQTSD